MVFNVAIAAFLGETCSTFIFQFGLILQKLAHRHNEEKQKKIQRENNKKARKEAAIQFQKCAINDENFIAASSQPISETASQDDIDQTAVVDQDQSWNTYCSLRFMSGLMLMIICMVLHIYLIQFLDLTLLAANSANSIVAVIILSTTILDEKFIWQYDLTALCFILIGCITIVMNANTVQTEYSAEEVKRLLSSPRTIGFFIFTISCIIISVSLMGLVLNRLRRFESDVDNYSKALKENPQAQEQDQDHFEAVVNILPSNSRKVINDQAVEEVTGTNSEALLMSSVQSEDCTISVQRPAHELIEGLNNIEDDLLQKVSERSSRIKYFIKVPMVLLVVTAALQSGLTIVFVKLLTELLQYGDFFDHIGLVVCICLSMALSGTVQLHTLNLAMKYYNQIEAIPVYQTSIMIIWILTGLIVFNEVQYYTNLQLVGIGCSIIFSCIGIKCLTMKTKMIESKKKEEAIIERERKSSMDLEDKSNRTSTAQQ